jgi:hypothetical protein
VPFTPLESERAAAPWRTYLWFGAATRLPDGELAERLARPPWAEARPDLVPAGPLSAEAARALAPPPRWGYLGRSLTGKGGPYATVYLDALLDQVVRAHQQQRLAFALELALRRLRLRPDGETAAWALEGLRREGRAADAEGLLASLSTEARRHPLVGVALALFDRDGGEERRARALLASVAPAFAGTAVVEAVEAPLSRWPATLDDMTRVRRRDAQVDSRN